MKDGAGVWVLRLVATREAVDFRAAAHRVLPRQPVGGPLELYATFYVPTLASDASNRIKSLEDALTGRLFYDDKQIAEVHLRKVITNDPEQVGVAFEVKPAEPLEHPELSKRLAASTIAERDAKRRQGKLFEATTAGVAAQQPAVAPGAAPRSFAAATGRVVPTETLAQAMRRLAKPGYIPPPEPTE